MTAAQRALLALGVGWTGLLWGTTLAGRLDHTPGGLLVGALLLLPWLHPITTGGLLLLAAAVRSRLAMGLLVAHLVLGLGRTSSCATGCVPRQSADQTLEVATWNLAGLGRWGGEGEVRCDTETAAPAVAEIIAEQAPDVLVLLEVSATRLEALSTRLSLQCEQIDYRGTGGGWQGGLAICARRDSDWRITRSRDLELPPDWAYVFAEVSRGEQRVNILGLHLVPLGVTTEDLTEAGGQLRRGRAPGVRTMLRTAAQAAARQSEQADRIREVIAAFSDPTVLAGDFNTTADAALHGDLRGPLTDAWAAAGWGFGATRTVGFLPLRIDYIYASDRLRPLRTRTFDCRCGTDQRCSDHRGVVSRLAVR